MTEYIRNQEKWQENGFPVPVTDHFGGFLIIGCITTCTDITLLWVLTDLCGVWYLVSAGLSFSASALLSFGLNKCFNFRNGSHEYVKQVSSFLIIASGSLMLNLAIISVFVELWLLNYLIAKVLATGIACIMNFFGQSRVTFRWWR